MRNTAANGILGAMQVIMDAWIIFAGVAWYFISKKKVNFIKKHAIPSRCRNNIFVQGNISGIINS